MSKKKLFNSAKLAEIRSQVKNTLTGEKSQALRDALLALIDELDSPEAGDVPDEEFTKKVLAIVNDNTEVPTAVAEAIAKRVTAVANSVNKELPQKVRNQICGAILRAQGRDAVENAVNAVLAKNEITGYDFPHAVDYTITTAWGERDELFKQLRKTPFTKFYYSEQDLKNAQVLAKQWDKTKNTEKSIQTITQKGKEIDRAFIYKRQQVSNEDLLRIEEQGEQTNFLAWLNDELDAQIVNTIVMAILIGDNVNTGDEQVTTFETIGSKTQSDVFTHVLNPGTKGKVTLKDLRTMVDFIKNPNRKKIVLCIERKTLTEVAEFMYAEGGSVSYRTDAEIAGMVGVGQVIIEDLLDGEDVRAIAFIPDGYWYNENTKGVIDVAYPEWGKNRQNFLKERYLGGAIHDLYSSAILREA